MGLQYMELRRLEEDSASLFRDIRLEALATEPSVFGASFSEMEAKPLAFFSQLLQQHYVIGAFDESGSLQGIVGISRARSGNTQHIATLFGMYVRACVRGKGVSKELVAAALDAARPAVWVKLAVNAENRVAQSLYRSFGFTQWALDEDALCINGVFHDEVLMRLPLS